MDKYTGVFQDSAGNLNVAGTATVRVTSALSDTLVPIYSSDSLAASKSNPFTLPSSGKIEFHARNGRVRVKVINGAIETLVDEMVMNAGVYYGTLAARPSAGSADRLYISSDAGTYYDNGSAWVELAVSLASLRTQAIGGGQAMVNGTLVASVNANALTFAIKTLAGTDPSPTDPVYIIFRNATSATGDYTVLGLTAATSFTVSSGSTLGSSDGKFRIWVVGFNDGGTFRLGVIQCVSGTAHPVLSARTVDSIYPLAGQGIASSTAEGGAGGADTAGTFYTGVAVTSKAYAVLGYATYEVAMTAGAYATVPSRLDPFRVGMPLPGYVIQTKRTVTGAVATGTTTIPNDDTVPQDSEGDQYMTVELDPDSGANAIRLQAVVNGAISAGSPMAAALYRTAETQAYVAVQQEAAANVPKQLHLDYLLLAPATTNTIYEVRAGPSTAGTMTFNGVSAGRKYGGVMNSYIQADEIMT